MRRATLTVLAVTTAVTSAATLGAGPATGSPQPIHGPATSAATATYSKCRPVKRARPHTVGVVNGGKRYRVGVHLPTGYSGRTMLPLVLNLHGSGGNGYDHEVHTRLSAVADKNHFVVAFPDGGVRLHDARHPDARKFAWNVPGVPLADGTPVPKGSRDDVRFVSDTINAVAATLCIDRRRVYVAGFSGGARMASAAGCALSTKIAGIAPVEGLRAGRPSTRVPGTIEPGTCGPKRHVAVAAFHALHDPTNPYTGGGGPAWVYSVDTAARRWARLDGCDSRPTTRRVDANTNRVEYRHCGRGGTVVLHTYDDAVHDWPGSASEPTSRSSSASVVLWRELSRFRLPA